MKINKKLLTIPLVLAIIIGLNSDFRKPIESESYGLVSQQGNPSKIVAGQNHVAALKSDGTVWVWGRNELGVFGDSGHIVKSTTPISVPGVNDIIDIATSSTHMLALKSDGTLLSWGSNWNGQLGINSADKGVFGPSTVLNISNVSKICTVSSSSVALKEDGTVWAWGDNNIGLLGMSGWHRSIPTKTSIEGIKDVYCGSATVYAIKEDNTVLSWGVDNNGQLGAGVVLNTRSNSEHVVGGESGKSILSNIKSISADYTETAVTFDGEVYSWGSNSKGQHGNGTVKTAWLHNSSPRKSIIDNVSHVSVKYEHALAIKTDGTLYSWGSNSSGQLFLGDTLDRRVPVDTGITDVHQVALTGSSSHIVKKRWNSVVSRW